jgi:hypothetical protein
MASACAVMDSDTASDIAAASLFTLMGNLQR